MPDINEPPLRSYIRSEWMDEVYSPPGYAFTADGSTALITEDMVREAQALRIQYEEAERRTTQRLRQRRRQAQAALRQRGSDGRFLPRPPQFTMGQRVLISDQPISCVGEQYLPGYYVDARFEGARGVIIDVIGGDRYNVRLAGSDRHYPTSQYIHGSSLSEVSDSETRCVNGYCDRILDEDAVTVRTGNGMGCEQCSEQCEPCGEYYLTAHSVMTELVDGSRACSNCYSYCDNCDSRIPLDEQCPNWENHPVERGIRGYGHTHPSMWLGGPLPKDDEGHHQGFYIGFENEISADSYASAMPIYEWAQEHLGNRDALECKEDGSVDGFEIVSQPMTPEFFESVDWESFMDLLNEHYPLSGAREPREHGLHVHIGRVAFERDDVATAAYAYLLNQGDHMERIGRRRATSYCQKVNKAASTAIVQLANSRGKHTVQSSKLSRDNYPGRDAINLLNSKTIEIRAFRSTRSADELRDAVRLTYLGAEYIRALRVGRRAVSPKALHWSEFARWVGTNHPEAFASIAGTTAPKGSNAKELVGAGAPITNFAF